MKICACFQVSADLDQMRPDDFTADEQMRVDTSFVRTLLNCFDESGLEFGLRVSEKSETLNLSFQKTALTVGSTQAELYLKTLLALKYDQAVRIDPEDTDLRFSPRIIAQAIAAYLKEHPHDLILMGRQAPVGNQFSTPQMLSACLGIPLVANALDLEPLSEDRVLVTTELSGSIYQQEIQLPAIVTIGNAEISKLRVPTLKDRMLYGKREPVCIPLAQLVPEKDQLCPDSLTYLNRARTGVVLPAAGAEGAEMLVGQYLEERLEGI